MWHVGRHIDSIHKKILQAIAYYRMKEADWKQELEQALDLAAEYQFIRTVSVYGTAVRPMLEELPHEQYDSKWWNRLMADVRMQTANDPMFLEPVLASAEELTATELQILRLICADKSNAEIGEIMNIKLSTVKTHVSHILSKLDVSRRSEAKSVAQKLCLVP